MTAEAIRIFIFSRDLHGSHASPICVGWHAFPGRRTTVPEPRTTASTTALLAATPRFNFRLWYMLTRDESNSNMCAAVRFGALYARTCID